MHENFAEVEQQMRAYGVLLDHESLVVPSGKRKTCGPKKKCWYKTHEFRRSDGRVFVVGSFGTYSTTLAKTLGLGGEGWRKIDVDWKGISDEERERMAAERQAAQQRERIEREEAHRWAAMSAAEIWEATARTGSSDYLVRKGVTPESCHFVDRTIRLARRDAEDRPITLPPGRWCCR
jgi:putative DNA primase/helicase